MGDGGKLAGLERLVAHQKLGYSVPQFTAIGIEYFASVHRQHLLAQLGKTIAGRWDARATANWELPADIRHRVLSLFSEYDGPVMVRSNGLHEGTEHSFRGIYVSESAEDDISVLTAAATVYISFFSDKAEAYRRERGVIDDGMNPIIQKRVNKPDYAGVMHTSNPSYPDDLSIEMTPNEDAVTSGEGNPFILDIDKRSKRHTFVSENLSYSELHKLESVLERLTKIGIMLEKKLGSSYIEFSIKGDELYFYQHDPLTIEKPTPVVVPKYPKEQHIAKTNVFRGNGSVTLPVVYMRDLQDTISPLAFSRQTTNAVQDWFTLLKRSDKQFKNGYVLILPHFHQSTVPMTTLLAGLDENTSLDSLTPNKKGIITTKFAARSSHAQTVAREKGLFYLGFGSTFDDKTPFDDIETGDILSIFFRGRQAHVFLENTPAKSIYESVPHMRFVVNKNAGGVHVETKSFIDSTKPYTNDLVWFLQQHTGRAWQFKPFDGRYGGVVHDEQRHSFTMHMGRLGYTSHTWTLSSDDPAPRSKLRPVPQAERERIFDAYAAHLRKT